MPVLLEIHSGPYDGLCKPWPEQHSQVMLHNTQSPDVFLVINYDPQFPSEGVRMRLQDAQGGIELQLGNVTSFKRFGELFQVGQTWMCVQNVRKEA